MGIKIIGTSQDTNSSTVDKPEMLKEGKQKIVYNCLIVENELINDGIIVLEI